MIINMYTHVACVDIANKEYQRLSIFPPLQLGLALQLLQVSVRASRTLRCQQLKLFGYGFWYAGNPSNVKSPVQASTTGCVRTQGGVSGGGHASKCFNTFSSSDGRAVFSS